MLLLRPKLSLPRLSMITYLFCPNSCDSLPTVVRKLKTPSPTRAKLLRVCFLQSTLEMRALFSLC